MKVFERAFGTLFFGALLIIFAGVVCEITIRIIKQLIQLWQQP